MFKIMKKNLILKDLIFAKNLNIVHTIDKNNITI